MHPAARIATAGSPAGVRADGRTVITGDRAATELVESIDADIVLNGITGSIGLEPTLAALRAGRVLALANKESLVAGGSLVAGAAAPGQIVPGRFRAQRARPVPARRCAAARFHGWWSPRPAGRSAGGPPPRWPASPPAQALAHPTWAMGPVVTINSATLVNKGLEVIEAHLLFGIPYDRIEVVVHPQSVIHSMVTFVDGSTLAQASPPDMKLPIALALAWPHRLGRVAAACDFTAAASWTFEPVDRAAFPALDLAIAAGRAGGTVPAAFNAANEEAVDAFRHGHLRFTGISDVLARILDEADHAPEQPTGCAGRLGHGRLGPAPGPGNHRSSGQQRSPVTSDNSATTQADDSRVGAAR